MASAPAQREVVHAGGEVADHGAVFRSTDFGRSWTRTAAPPQTVLDVAVSPFDARTVYAAANHLYRSTDAGATWARVELPPQCVNLSSVPIHRASADTAIAAGRWGLVRTENGRDRYEMNDGLDEKHVNFIEWADGGNWLIAATAGRACYSWTEYVGLSGQSRPHTSAPALLIAPNPTAGLCRVSAPGIFGSCVSGTIFIRRHRPPDPVVWLQGSS